MIINRSEQVLTGRKRLRGTFIPASVMFEGIKKFAAEPCFDKKTLNHLCNLHDVAHNSNNNDNNDNKDDNDNDFFFLITIILFNFQKLSTI